MSQARHLAGHLGGARGVPKQLGPHHFNLGHHGYGDALAMIVALDFKPLDFARYHPGGSLGRKLLTQVHDVMHTRLPRVTSDFFYAAA